MLTALIALAMAAEPTPASPDAPPCARRVSIGFADPNGDFDGMSHSGAYMTVRNLGPRVCRVSGLPTVGLVDARGAVMAARAAPAFMHPGPVILPVVLAPGAKATAELRWVSGDVYDGHDCATPARVTVTLGALKVTKPWSGGQVCGPAGKPLPFTQSPLRPGPPSAKSAAIRTKS